MRLKRAVLVVLPGLLVGSLALTACSQGLDPCRDVKVSDEKSLAEIARDNPQIEIEAAGYNDVECILTPGGVWVDESELGDEDDG